MAGLRQELMTRRFSLVSAFVVALAVLPRLWAVLVHPIDKGSVYVGPIAAYTGLSLALWAVSSLVAAVVATWIHFRCPALRRQSWFALLAGESFHVGVLFVTGGVIQRGLDGDARTDALSILILAAAMVGCAWGTREALREPASRVGTHRT